MALSVAAGAAPAVPGVVIDYSPAASRCYIGSPSIAILPNGDYAASHDIFGPGSTGKNSVVFGSSDRGATWHKLAELDGQWWSSLFVQGGALYILGTTKEYGAIVIRRSDDGGRAWSRPAVLRDDGQYHCAPVPVLLHDGRLWRAFERRSPPLGWGTNFCAGMLSAPADADLLKPGTWTASNFLPGDTRWLDRGFGGWLEGNAVATRDGRLLDILRVDTPACPEKAALVSISRDGRTAAFDPQTGFVNFPGGAKKFTIRYDEQTRLYWSLATVVPERHQVGSKPGGVRNTLALTSSPDLTNWTVRCHLLYNPDVGRHGFQYVDWLFEGRDIIAACRTAYDDAHSGAHNAHDANYLTFHRVADFRTKTMADSVPMAELPVTRVETAAFTLQGRGWTLAKLDEGGQAFGNRRYVWKNVPAQFRGWQFTQTCGGERAEMRVQAKRDTILFVTTTTAQKLLTLPGWTPVPTAKFHYDDKGRTPMAIYSRAMKAGEELAVPQGNWSGTLLLLPTSESVTPVGSPAAAPALERLHYNHPGLIVDLGVGLWAFPLPMDFTGDGKLDLVVDCPDKPYNGVYVFENPGVDTSRNPLPVFRPARRISPGLQMAQVSRVEGQQRVLTPATEFPGFLQTGLEKGRKLPLPANVHSKKVRGNFWRYVDFDGDGKTDIVVGADDWTAYGWDNAYTPQGVWTNGPLRGFVYVVRNIGTDQKPVYEKPVLVLAGDQPVETFGWPSPNFADFRGTGKLDLICGEFRDRFTFFENIGTRTQPRYAPGRQLKTPDGKPLAMDLEMITPVAMDWNHDGHVDLICGDEDGRVAFIENTGKLAADGTPLFLPPRYFQQEADDLKCGALATPVGFDWDGDGAMDILSGNSAGYIEFFKNLSGPGVEKPKWAAPQYLESDGKVIRIMAGPNGSIQGPAEAKWGYTTLSVADWDGDGLPDLLVNSIWGNVVWFKNIGTRQSPKLAAAQPIEVEWDKPQPALAWGWLRSHGKELLTQWRTTPVAVDWNKDGLMDLVMLDQEGYLAFFERARRDGKLVLLPPQRVFCDEQGEPLRLNDKIAGKSGRRKICIVDWDGDGKLDILLNAANARFLRQVDARDGKWFFKDMGLLVEQNIEGHDVSPTVVDFNGDGIPDFLGGAEDGHFYYLRNPRTKAPVSTPVTKQPSAILKQEFIFETAPFASCHATTLVEPRGGGLVAAWFGGTREGNKDVGIWLARQTDGRWSVPVEVATGVQPDGTRQPCWNPVLFQPKAGPLLLFYKVGPSPSRWWGLLRTSADGGKTWSDARRLPDGILGPIKNKPVQLPGGDLLCGTSTEDDGWRVHFERTRDGGQTWTATAPVNDGQAIGAIQPSILFQSSTKLEAVGRTKQKHVFQIWSEDGGKSWGPMSLLDLPNPNAGTDAVTLRDGRQLLVYNHTPKGRSPLNVALSRDGKVWQPAVVLENGPGEYSYPAVIQTSDGLVHIGYTWKRERIKHVVLDPAQLGRLR